MTRRSRRSQGLSDGTRGLLLAVLGLILIGVLGGSYWWIKRTRPVLNAETNCPITGPTGIHIILFDRSDPISDQQGQRIRQTIERFKLDAPFGLRFDIYTFNGDTTHVLQPRLQLCALGKPNEANPLIENPEKVRKQYEAKFSAVIDQTVTELLRVSSENSSPVIESLRAASITSFGAVLEGQIPLRVTMISDMIQHTSLFSQFQAEPSFQTLSRSATWPAMQPQLKGADVDILYLLRPTATRKGVPIQSRGHQVFWEQLISASGGRLTASEPL